MPTSVFPLVLRRSRKGAKPLSDATNSALTPSVFRDSTEPNKRGDTLPSAFRGHCQHTFFVAFYVPDNAQQPILNASTKSR